MVWLEKILQYALEFAFLYPLLMAYLWMTGALLYYFRFEWKKPNYDEPPELPEYPLVSIVVPCYNEEANAVDTLSALADLHYPNYEIVAVNDGSQDGTAQVLNSLLPRIARLRVVHLATNQGKALALKAGAMAAKGDFLVCIDGDAILDHYAVTWIMDHFIHSPRVGAVTGNPRIRTRSTLLGRLQVGEFSAIIGLLKRAQRIYGRVFTISGVIASYRRLALHRVGYWSEETLTEDIDISWRLQLNHWDVRFEPRALCWILMPETLRGLFQQRLRWAIGGGEAMKKYSRQIFQWKSRRMWGIYVEYGTSILWSYTMLALAIVWFLKLFIMPSLGLPGLMWRPQLSGAILAFTCLVQFAVSMYIDRRYDHRMFFNFLHTVWYPLFYWVLNWIVSVLAFPQAMFFRRKGSRGRWVTTDRGIADDPADTMTQSDENQKIDRKK